MTRRAILLASLVAARLRADAAGDVWDLVGALASALTARQANQALSFFDPAMPDYTELREYVTGMLRQREVESSITPVQNDGTDRERTVVLDWTLTISDPGNDAHYVKRQRPVSCRVVKNGRKWRIVRFEPIMLFAPPYVEGAQPQASGAPQKPVAGK